MKSVSNGSSRDVQVVGYFCAVHPKTVALLEDVSMLKWDEIHYGIEVGQNGTAVLATHV